MAYFLFGAASCQHHVNIGTGGLATLTSAFMGQCLSHIGHPGLLIFASSDQVSHMCY